MLLGKLCIAGRAAVPNAAIAGIHSSVKSSNPARPSFVEKVHCLASSTTFSYSLSSCSLASPDPPDYLSLSDKELFLQCNMDTFRSSGPGGQHRNKTESAVRLTHLPTGLVSQAADDRSQHQNRAYALERLCALIAAKVRRPVDLDSYQPPPELIRILPVVKGQKGVGQRIGHNHPDFCKGVQCFLDLLLATQGSVSAAASKLGITTGALSKVITSDKSILLPTNHLRASMGLKPLR